jgi:hypothetical protein
MGKQGKGGSAKPTAFAPDPADATDELRCTVLRLVRSGDSAGIAKWLAEAPFATAAAAVDSRLCETESAAALRKLSGAGLSALAGRRVCRFYLLGDSDTLGAYYAGTVTAVLPPGTAGAAFRARVRYSDGEDGDLDADALADCILPDPKLVTNGWTPLHVAAVNGRVDVAQALLRVSSASAGAKAHHIPQLLAAEKAAAAAPVARGGGGGRGASASASATEVTDENALLTPAELALLRGHTELAALLARHAAAAPAPGGAPVAARRAPCAYPRCAGLPAAALAPSYCYYPPPPAEQGRPQGPFCVTCLAGWRKHFPLTHTVWAPPATGPTDARATTYELALADAIVCGALDM